MLNWLIAGWHLRLKSSKEQIAIPWRDLYPAFQTADDSSSPPPTPDVLIDASRLSGRQSGILALRILQEDDKELVGSSVLVESLNALGRYTWERGAYRGRFELDRDDPFGLLTTLRIAIAALAEKAGGLLLHASGVWSKGGTWVFCGPSSSGKSTIALELKGGRETFCEDEIVLKFDETGALVAHATPFGDYRQTRSCPLSARVLGIAFIRQGKAPGVSELSIHDCASALLRESQWYTRSRGGAQRALDNINRIIEATACVRLEFKKDETFWPYLERLAAKE